MRALAISHFLNKRPIQHYENMRDSYFEIHVLLVQSLYNLKQELNLILPKEKYPDIGEKYSCVSKNIFQNCYFHELIDKCECDVERMLKSYLNIIDDSRNTF